MQAYTESRTPGTVVNRIFRNLSFFERKKSNRDDVISNFNKPAFPKPDTDCVLCVSGWRCGLCFIVSCFRLLFLPFPSSFQPAVCYTRHNYTTEANSQPTELRPPLVRQHIVIISYREKGICLKTFLLSEICPKKSHPPWGRRSRVQRTARCRTYLSS